MRGQSFHNKVALTAADFGKAICCVLLSLEEEKKRKVGERGGERGLHYSWSWHLCSLSPSHLFFPFLSQQQFLDT